MLHSLDAPTLDVILTTEAWPPRFAWRTPEGVYIGASLTEAGRAEAIARQGHRIVSAETGKPVEQAEPIQPKGPEPSAEAIREGGMVLVRCTEGRGPEGPVRSEVLASPVFPDLQKVIRRGPDKTPRTTFRVAGQEVPANPAAIVAALVALGPARQPPMEQRQ
jgi:hypothetical protein